MSETVGVESQARGIGVLPPRVAGLLGTYDAPKERWVKIEAMLATIETAGLDELQPECLAEMGKLYGELLSDLGVARLTGHRERSLYLNRLAGRLYSLIYRRPSVRFSDFITFFIDEVPRLVRERWRSLLVAAAILAVAFGVGWLCLRLDSKLIKLVIPAPLGDEMGLSLWLTAEGGSYVLTEYSSLAANRHLLWAGVATSFFGFAGGIVLGVGPVYLLVMYGLLLGGLAGLFGATPASVGFWSQVAPWGVFILPAVVIGAGAGFVLGYALIDPGRYRRADWLAIEGAVAVKLMLGCLPIFALGALFETWVSRTPLPPPLRLTIAAIAAALLAGYLLLGGSSLLRFGRS